MRSRGGASRGQSKGVLIPPEIMRSAARIWRRGWDCSVGRNLRNGCAWRKMRFARGSRTGSHPTGKRLDPPRGSGGGGGIRTHGTLRPSGFQDRRNRPLCHPSLSEGRHYPHFASQSRGFAAVLECKKGIPRHAGMPFLKKTGSFGYWLVGFTFGAVAFSLAMMSLLKSISSRE